MEDRLVALMAKVRHDPLGFARAAYAWGQGELADSSGPRVWQAEVLDELGEHLRNPATRYTPFLKAISSGHGIGKAHPVDYYIETPNGNKRWGDLSIGDSVFDANGIPTLITATNHYKNIPMYRVTFDDGSFCDVSSGHLWNVRGRQERRKRLDSWRTLETADILELGVKRPNGVALARQWEIPTQGAAQFTEREIDLHPYFVGVWLGDGCKGKPSWTKPFDEVTDKVKSLGYEIKSHNSEHRILNITHLMHDPVFSLGSHERYIPNDYKFNTVENRMALLQGLLDTDGEVNKTGSIGYASTSKRLAEDIIWLARSLGCKATMQNAIKHGWYPDKDGKRVECRDCWRVTISAPFNPFTIKHRKDRYKPSESRYITRWIDSIEPIGCADGMCIKVDNADGLYLANDFIVTHNSSLISMVLDWGMSTCPDCKIVVTANTGNQLATKTWPEIAKWIRLSINKHWFNVTATAIAVKDKTHERTWRADAIPWSDNNTEAFAGMHNKGRRIILIFDEGSAISDKVWEVAEGALTDENTEIIWLAFGNPTRNSGRFRECFGRLKHRWSTKQIDSRTVEGTNKAQIAQWIADYGEDSDFARVRIKGEFPRAGSMQFIGGDLVDAARKREAAAYRDDPCVMGVDVARFGDDASCIVIRRGRDARSIPWKTLRNVDTMTLSAAIVDLAREYKPDAIFVDEGGVGGGVVDRLRMLKQPVVGVQFGGKADRSAMKAEGAVKYANKRAEIWGNMRDWLAGGAVPDDPELAAELTGVEYGYVFRDGADCILLEKKSDMKKRGLSSPDKADALALTFSYPVVPSDHKLQLTSGFGRSNHQSDYNPLSRDNARKIGR